MTHLRFPLVALLAAICTLALLSGCGKTPESPKAKTGTGDSAKAASDPTPSKSGKSDGKAAIKAEDLAKEFAADEKAAGKKHNGQVLKVAGVVQKVEPGTAESVDVILKGDKLGVKCMFMNFATTLNKAKAVKAGDKVTIQGLCGGTLDECVGLAGCELVE